MIPEHILEPISSSRVPRIERQECFEFLPSGRGEIDISGLPFFRDHDVLLRFVLNNPNTFGFRRFEADVVYLPSGKMFVSPSPEDRGLATCTYVGFKVLGINELRGDPNVCVRYWHLRDLGYTHVVMVEGSMGNFHGLNISDKVYNRQAELIFEMTEEATLGPSTPPRRKPKSPAANPDSGVN